MHDITTRTTPAQCQACSASPVDERLSWLQSGFGKMLSSCLLRERRPLDRDTEERVYPFAATQLQQDWTPVFGLAAGLGAELEPHSDALTQAPLSPNPSDNFEPQFYPSSIRYPPRSIHRPQKILGPPLKTIPRKKSPHRRGAGYLTSLRPTSSPSVSRPVPNRQSATMAPVAVCTTTIT
jgi:hypothetical protein